MPYTIAQVETALTSQSRLGLYLDLMGVDLTVAPNITSPRPVFADAITSALMFCRIYPPDPTAPSDADMVKLANTDWMKLLDVAEFRFLDAYIGTVAATNVGRQWDHYKEQLGNNQPIVDYWKSRQLFIRNTYGYGVGRLKTGSIRVTGNRSNTPEF